jgi:DNA primase
VVLMLDGDTTGRAASRTISARLSAKCSVVLINMPQGTQPDQLSPAGIQEVVLSAQVGGALFETCP